MRNLPSQRLMIKCLTIIQIELEFGNRGKPEYPEKNLSEQGREPTTNSTHIWRRVWESNPGHIGGRPAWKANAQPLRHPCSPGVARMDTPKKGWTAYTGHDNRTVIRSSSLVAGGIWGERETWANEQPCVKIKKKKKTGPKKVNEIKNSIDKDKTVQLAV